jgi:hypothetical protein
MLWGHSLEFWDRMGIRLMFGGAAVGVIALLASLVSAYVLYRVADESEKKLETTTRDLTAESDRLKLLTAQALEKAEEERLARAKIEEKLYLLNPGLSRISPGRLPGV